MDGSNGEPPPAHDVERAPIEPTLDEALALWKAALAATAASLAGALGAARRRGWAMLAEARAARAPALQSAWMRGRAPGAALLIAGALVVSGSGLGASPRANHVAAQPPPLRALAETSSSPNTLPALSRGVAVPRTTSAPGNRSRATYTGSVEFGQGCPGGRAPKPATGAIGSAGDYGAPRLNTVALTFDDGPSPTSSPAILSFLEQTRTPATFFVLGQYAKAYPSLIRREAADGFTIGIHTWSHPNMRLLTPAQRAWQFTATVQALRADLGPSFCVWLWRPPYESFDTSIVRQAGSFGLTTILWNVDPADWARPGVTAIVTRVLAAVRPGSIILLHDGPADRQQTDAALPYILAGLRQRGLTPVSLPQLLLGYQPPAASPAAVPTAISHSPATISRPSPIAAPGPARAQAPAATATPSPASAQAAARAPTSAPTPPTLSGYPIAPYRPGQRFGGWSRMGGGG